MGQLLTSIKDLPAKLCHLALQLIERPLARFGLGRDIAQSREEREDLHGGARRDGRLAIADLGVLVTTGPILTRVRLFDSAGPNAKKLSGTQVARLLLVGANQSELVRGAPDVHILRGPAGQAVGHLRRRVVVQGRKPGRHQHQADAIWRLP